MKELFVDLEALDPARAVEPRIKLCILLIAQRRKCKSTIICVEACLKAIVAWVSASKEGI